MSTHWNEGKVMAVTSPETQLVTRLLHEWRNGDSGALNELMPIVYRELRCLAGRLLAAERPGHTLSATALVHEAYLRLVDADIAWQDRTHFYAISARVLRRILVDHAKTQNRQKRGGGAETIPLDEAILVGSEAADIVVDLDEALDRLAIQDARKSEIIQLLFFGGLTYDETADALNISPATVHRELKLAKAWLYRELAQDSV
jgi:RNA polymerase sigma factor (TIGR02999 family)